MELRALQLVTSVAHRNLQLTTIGPSTFQARDESDAGWQRRWVGFAAGRIVTRQC